MKADDPFPARITRLLMPLGPVRARSMFGGCGIFLDDLMFALITWNRLYFKVDDETKPRFARVEVSRARTSAADISTTVRAKSIVHCRTCCASTRVPRSGSSRR